MELNVEGITEEIYGLWLNGFPQSVIPVMNGSECQVIQMGFDLERIKNFAIRPGKQRYTIFVKVSNDKEYDIYREHLITLVKILIMDKSSQCQCVTVFIVSDRYEDYKNELCSFFTMSTSYLCINHFGERQVLLTNFAMACFGVNITEFFMKSGKWLTGKVKSFRNS